MPFPIPFVQRSSFSDQEYLLGLRGLLVIQSFLWVFLQVFVPVAVKDSQNITGPGYQQALRKTVSVLFWNENLLYSSFILLSGRVLAISFLNDPSKTSIASAIFRRGIRLWFPTAVALALVKIIFSTTGLDYIDQFKTITQNVSIGTPYSIPNTLAYFNSVFNLFWMTTDFASQAGSQAFPSQTLWIVNVIYSQSYTIFMTMIIIPYTRNRWRVEAYFCFIITAWWVQSWAWYSITGLALADAVMKMDFKTHATKSIPIWRFIKLPSRLLYILLILVGLLMQYIWAAWKPELENEELKGHTNIYQTTGLNTMYDLGQPQARDDNYVFLLGFFLLLESSTMLQAILSNPLFCYLGDRSLSWFLMQSTIIYTAGIKLFMHLSTENHWHTSSAVITCLVVCIPTTVVGAEIFHQTVDYPSRALARITFDWIRK